MSYMVTREEDIIAGLEKLGLLAVKGKTKVPEWTRIYIHQPMGKDHHGIERPTLYIARVSLHHGMLYTWKAFGLPGYWHAAIKVLLERKKLLNHIMYLTLGVQAYNETLDLKLAAEDITISKKDANKRTREYYYQKGKLFASLFKKRYYPDSSATTGNIHVHLLGN